MHKVKYEVCPRMQSEWKPMECSIKEPINSGDTTFLALAEEYLSSLGWGRYDAESKFPIQIRFNGEVREINLTYKPVLELC